jgi:hypothetical protein
VLEPVELVEAVLEPVGNVGGRSYNELVSIGKGLGRGVEDEAELAAEDATKEVEEEAEVAGAAVADVPESVVDGAEESVTDAPGLVAGESEEAAEAAEVTVPLDVVAVATTPPVVAGNPVSPVPVGAGCGLFPGVWCGG